MKTLLMVGALLGAAAANAASVDLATSVDPGNGSLTDPVGGLLSENDVTGSFAQIARDPDGLFNVADPSQQFGAIDLFPNEGDFGVGSLDYDDAGLIGSGVEVFPVTSLDTGDLWTAGSSTSDISDTAIDGWFFGPESAFIFGAPAGTVTLTDGLLTSIDVVASATFVADFGGFGQAPFSGTLEFSGDEFALQINDTFTGGTFPITFVADLQGVVNAVVPEPNTALLLASVLAPACSRQRR